MSVSPELLAFHEDPNRRLFSEAWEQLDMATLYRMDLGRKEITLVEDERIQNIRELLQATFDVGEDLKNKTATKANLARLAAGEGISGSLQGEALSIDKAATSPRPLG